MADLVTGPVTGVGTEAQIPGVHFASIPTSSDLRGSFAKPYTRPTDSDEVLREVFWSVSAARVVRGLHLQGPQTASTKNVFLTSGLVFDVIVDVRTSSPTYGQFRAYVLDPSVTIRVPQGCAHGFQALEASTMVYLCDMPYDQRSDHGIRFDTIGIPWPLASPTVSERDLALPTWQDYETPFQ